MRLLIPSYGRADAISTHRIRAFGDMRRLVIVHDRDQALAYEEALAESLHPVSILASVTPPGPAGKARQLAAAFDLLGVKPDEWVAIADDDMQSLTAVEPYWYDEPELNVQFHPEVWPPRFSAELDPTRWAEIVAESIARAEGYGARLVGFATTRNPYFRGRKWRSVGYVMGGLMLWRYDPSYPMVSPIGMDDFRDSAEHIRRYGAVVINNFVRAECSMYIAGGHGKREDRLEQRWTDIRALDAEYPGFFRVHLKDGYPDLRVRLTSEAQVERWRRFKAS